MQRTEDALNRLREDVTDIKVTLATNTQSLAEHMRRTDLLERRLESIWTKALTALSIISALVVLAKEMIH